VSEVGKDASSGIDTTANVAHPIAKLSAFQRGSLLALVVGLGTVVAYSISHRSVPERCPPGRNARQHRCCWEGQDFDQGYCKGDPTICLPPYEVSASGACVLFAERVPISGGQLHLAPNDWQAQGLVQERTLNVGRFSIDRTEVPVGRRPEPFLPWTNLEPERAERYCRNQGGRLPSADEWIFAASGPEGRRFPWGQTGLVCRRAVYGLVRGPCARSDAAGPDAVGSRPDGATPEGLLDMVGNVAEWVRQGDHYVAMGGSFKSELASELKVWSQQAASGARADVGFRCAYDE
jgi:hypothetical protein